MMKHNTKYILLASLMSLLTLAGCQRDDMTVSNPAGDGILNFSVGFAGSGELTLTKGTTLTSADEAVSIPLSCAVTDGIEVNLPDAEGIESASVTKGTQINSETEFLGEELTSFTAAGWNADKSSFVPSATTVSYSNGIWQTADIYRWRGTDSKTFLAYANLPSSGATVTNSVDPSVKQTFTYTVPTDARQQNDIMLGWYEGNGGGTATAAITMVHPLTAVVFKKGEMEGITAIKSISISGVYVSGTADVTYALPDGDVVPTYNWGSSRTGSQTVTLSPAGEATELEVAADGKIGTSFIILPQEVAANTLKFKITVVKDGADAILAATVPAGTWAEGKTNTFTIGYEKPLGPLLPGKFSVSETKYVQFSRGNLMATRSSSSSDDWKLGFFANQYDYGKATSFTANDTEMSLFTFGFDSKETSFDPIGQATGSEDWGNEYNRQYSLPSGTWQTLTGGPDGEWWYLLDGRPNAANLKAIKTVHGISNCLIIFPDDFDLSDIPSSTELTDDQWSDLEAKGAVCLPQAGLRFTSAYYTSSSGYWANNSYGAYLAYGAFFTNPPTVVSYTGGARNYGYSVRLVQKFDWPEVEPDFIDLGLPSGTLWADVNVGAVSKTGAGSYGKFFAWGETESKTTYTIDNYKFTSSFTKYNGTDHLTELQSEDDVAAAKVSGSHIPTRQQYEELINSTYTTCTWTDDYNSTGVPGLVITSKSNSNSIFLPAAGLQNGPTPGLVGKNGCYWSRTLNPTPKEGEGTSFPACAIDLDFGKNIDDPFVYKDDDDSQRFMGQSVRAVK